MSAREDPATPGMHPPDRQLARNGARGTALALERRRSRRTAMGRFSGWELDLLIGDFARFIRSEVALLCQPANNGQPPAVIAYWGPAKVHEQIKRQREGGLVARALPLPCAVLEPLHPRLDSSLVHATDPPLTCAAAAPVRLPNAPAGRLIAGFVTPPRDRALTLWTAESYAALVALHLTDPQALNEALARRDGLTGCLTDDGTRYELDCEINRSARDDLRLSVCVIDLDDFLGHPRRNAMLALSAGIVRTNVRSSDAVGRYGGGGLVAILPQTSRNEAQQVAERLRSQLTNSLSAASERALTPSLGVAQWTSGTPSEDLLAAADSARLVARRSARLMCAREPGVNTTLPGGGQPPSRIHTTDRKN
jgi:diguanylate cyclase (GGDEF)-like protein